ncbi:MAG: hypothetical protein ABT20_11390 [Rubrivivax sp. SCN 70-15]|nr:MAG: hypothetical protein ABT20_11390 [Rubrivivax sp. SCN 70-15]
MHCSPKTMLKVAAGLGAILAIAYFTVPQAQALVLASAPVLLALVCPLSMLLMAFTMRGPAGGTSCKSTQSGPAVTEPRGEAEPSEGRAA